MTTIEISLTKKSTSKWKCFKWAQQGSNLRPPDYESGALTD